MKKILIMVVALSTSGVLLAAPSSAAVIDVQGNVAAAENKVAMCIGCRAIPDYKVSFPEVYRMPYLGGQNAKYIESALRAYQKGDRKHLTMCAIAGSLTDQDIANLAAYYAAQTPTTQNNPQKRRGTI